VTRVALDTDGENPLLVHEVTSLRRDDPSLLPHARVESEGL
jgi:hypothetical protein